MEKIIYAEVSVANRDYKYVMKPCMKGHFHVLNDTHVFGVRSLKVRCDEYFAAYCKNHIEDGVGFEITGKEYRNCGNGYYYLLINDTYVIGCDID